MTGQKDFESRASKQGSRFRPVPEGRLLLALVSVETVAEELVPSLDFFEKVR